jgi:hypothetical protein
MLKDNIEKQDIKLKKKDKKTHVSLSNLQLVSWNWDNPVEKIYKKKYLQSLIFNNLNVEW